MRKKITITMLGVFILLAGMLPAGAWPVAAPAADAAVAASVVSRQHHGFRFTTGLDAVSSAIPSASDPQASDSAQTTVRTQSATKTANAASLATSNCDGCSGTATTFQVAYFDGFATLANNSAVAWSSCSGCTSSAVSVQLVIARRAGAVTVNNRAMALNVECTECNTNAAAIQFVVAGGSRRDLSAQAKNLIGQIQTELADRLNGPPAAGRSKMAEPESKALADETAQKLQQIIVGDIGAGTVTRNIDVQTGN